MKDRDSPRYQTPNPDTWEISFILKVPYCSEASTRILRTKIKKSKLPIKLVTQSGTTVANLVKRQLKTRVAPERDCTCDLHQNDTNCRERYVVYQATCTHCNDSYIGETTRTVISRMKEHESSTRLGNRRTPLGEHLLDEHPHLISGGSGTREWDTFLSNFKVDILGRSRDTLGTYLLEDHLIRKLRPRLNTQCGNGYSFWIAFFMKEQDEVFSNLI